MEQNYVVAYKIHDSKSGQWSNQAERSIATIGRQWQSTVQRLQGLSTCKTMILSLFTLWTRSETSTRITGYGAIQGLHPNPNRTRNSSPKGETTMLAEINKELGGGKKCCVGFSSGSASSTFTINTVDNTTGESFTAKYFMFLGTYSSTNRASGYYNVDSSDTTYIRNAGNTQDTQNLPNSNMGLNKIEPGVVTMKGATNVYYLAVGE